MRVIGITGTNGKTTTAYLLAVDLRGRGHPLRHPRHCRATASATRSAKRRDDARSAGRAGAAARDGRSRCGACAMEVSSHALSLQRVDGMTFAAAVFTNLTRDHLDFHADMDDYFRAKRRLFEMLPHDAPSLINLDDPRGAVAGRSGRTADDLRDQPAGRRHAGSAVVLARRTDVRRPHAARHAARASKLVGRPNVYNILAAVATATALDLPFDAIERGVASLDGVPGRFQVVSTPRTKSPSSSTTRTPTMRCGICSRPRGRWRSGR